MPTIFIIPTATTNGGYQRSPFVSNHLNVDDPVATPDDSSTYNFATISGVIFDEFTGADANIPSAATITSVKCSYRTDHTGNGATKMRIVHDATYNSPVDGNIASWTTFSFDLTVEEAWQPADFDGGGRIMFGYENVAHISGENRITQVYIEVQFTLPPSPFKAKVIVIN